MPIRKRITWGPKNPFGDSRLANLPALIRAFRKGRLPVGWRGHRIWENRWLDLPVKPAGWYREYYLGTPDDSGTLRLVLGNGGEVYVSGNHHHDWRQVIDLPQ